jgi:hypothetical protein
MAVSCTTRALPSGLIDVRVSIHNSTALARPAVIYGPALRHTHYVHPVLRTEEVVVQVGTSPQAFPGWIVPRVPTDKPAHVTLWVERPVQPATIIAHEIKSLPKPAPNALSNTTYVFKAENWDVLKNDQCVVTSRQSSGISRQ